MNRIESTLLKSIQKAREEDYSSYDISDLMLTKYYGWSSRLPKGALRKVIQTPYRILMKRNPQFLRSLVNVHRKKYPQGFAMTIRGYIQLLKKEYDLVEFNEVTEIAKWLIENRSSHSKHYGWGQPFLWYSRKPFPPNTPRATVSSQVAWAFLDLFEYTKDEQYLDIAKDVCYLFKNEFNYTRDGNGNFCLSYTTIDNYHIHNASMLAASVISRVARITNSEELFDFGKRLVDFTLSHQNEDGSFYYWAPPDKLNFMIDNYHTGFVLESLQTIFNDFDSSEYERAYNLGMEFYLETLFDGAVPMLSTKKKYPIDIQSCAQSIITFSSGDLEEKYRKKADQIAAYCIDNFFLENDNYFAYRIFENGKMDKSYYYRWGDAWMIKALSYLL